MSGSVRFNKVPVIDINMNNIKEVWPSLVLAVKTSTFVAMDTELSGLGNRKLLVAKSLPDRYKNLCEVAKTRSVLSLGLSCFKLQGTSQRSLNTDTASETSPVDRCPGGGGRVKQWTYSVQTFNVMLLCSEDFMVEPSALRFLVEHGFDFNKQYAAGVPYYRGKENTTANEADSITSKAIVKTSGPTARQLFDILLWSNVPIVFHNGFVDLVFLYQNLYTDLPNNLQTFLADLAEMFPQGVLDTKYIVEFVDRLPASYLEYVFRKWQRRNALQANAERSEVCLEFPLGSLKPQHVSYSHCDLPGTCVEMDYIPKASVLQDLVCLSFAGHGWCTRGKQCPKSHAIDLILDLDGIKTAKNRKRRRRLHHQQKEQTSDSGNPDAEENMDRDTACNRSVVSTDALGSSENMDSAEQASLEMDEDLADSITDAYLKSSYQLEEGRSGGHRAGFDAFMTGFIMACLLSKHATVDETVDSVLGAGIKLKQLKQVDHLRNKVYCTCKDQPLIVAKSNFASTSKNHRERIEHVRKSSVQ